MLHPQHSHLRSLTCPRQQCRFQWQWSWSKVLQYHSWTSRGDCPPNKRATFYNFLLTLPETNREFTPENGYLEKKHFPLWGPALTFRCKLLGFREGKSDVLNVVFHSLLRIQKEKDFKAITSFRWSCRTFWNFPTMALPEAAIHEMAPWANGWRWWEINCGWCRSCPVLWCVQCGWDCNTVPLANECGITTPNITSNKFSLDQNFAFSKISCLEDPKSKYQCQINLSQTVAACFHRYLWVCVSSAHDPYGKSM